MSKPIIGIMVHRKGLSFSEPKYFRDLSRAGERLGADVFLFSPADINLKARQIRGFTAKDDGSWSHRMYPWPQIVIDRYRRPGNDYMKIRTSSLFRYANNRFTNKWRITRMFMQESKLARWMPETIEYSGAGLNQMLKKHSLLYIKPGNGTGGSSIVRLKRTKAGYAILGRSRTLTKINRHFASFAELKGWLDQWTVKQSIRNGAFMIQQGVDLSLVEGRVTDARLLIQKTETGVWDITGMGMRIGAVGSSTSNLHGGGKAASFESVVEKRFGSEKAAEIRKECHELARTIVQVIESHFDPMMEFGIDIGIDVQGRVWLIEVNPKPGRELFKSIGDSSLYRKTVERPIQYAMYLARKQKQQS
ncbi:YheC/YheD family endospore coat-associated protein [Gorillibacterium timonense]|uniref:YheC/YheD family endospore coat-associated protein n=1 Tax=Gorillibacterium timonense TaxID=1689269 RepID=UPI00071C9921|nr:YheC/YheD family protein [Gorillibacterium timonense]